MRASNQNHIDLIAWNFSSFFQNDSIEHRISNGIYNHPNGKQYLIQQSFSFLKQQDFKLSFL